METLAWRYHPEFTIQLLINGQDAGDRLRLVPAPPDTGTFARYGLLTKSMGSQTSAFVKQKPDGGNWAPLVSLSQPVVFAFWLAVNKNAAALPDFFREGKQQFGRKILYANNVSGSGAIDSNLSGNAVSLTAATEAGNAERGAVSPFLLSAGITPGTFTFIRAGRIQAGAAVSYTINQALESTQTRAALDFRQQPAGAYLVKLDGASPVEEPVVVNEQAVLAGIDGIIEIHRDTWHLPLQPRIYNLNFLST
ncbi:hypothetical protein [Chitinophaga japonensis]|uniref:Uncharacterized protein n=1 Tax=Chitinophaga japonensis TaxID=104662 RepID=A0A562T155_CHIJA|nr:hypothetical protein [Chitinophaga japonensis]TWI87013.1 hypothetical protein LX66_4281 [Chitinophaga japonensis]